MSKRERPIRMIVAVSDLHAGSKLSPLTPTPYTCLEDGTEVYPNKIQQWLNSCWEDAWARAEAYIGSEPWAFVLVGDAIEGRHHSMDHLVSLDPADHVHIAVGLLRPHILSARHRFFVKGTYCHTGPSSEARLGVHLKADRHPDTHTFSADRWRLTVDGFPLVFRHHIPVTSREHLRASQLSIQLANEQVAAARRGHTVPMGLIGGHRHLHDLYSDGRSFCLTLGPWQQATRHSHTNWSPMVPEPSLCILDFRDREPDTVPYIEVFKYTPTQDHEVQL